MEDGTQININLTYPNNPEYEYISKLTTIDMDKEAQNDINSGNGFLVSAPHATIKKDIKNIDGIYSSRFGQKLGDVNPFANRYSCECGYVTGRVYNGVECPMCHTKVKYVDDNFGMFGWIVLNDEYHIIHPKFFDTLNIIMGESPYNTERKKSKPGKDKKKIDKNYKLKNIINYSPEVDQDGMVRECEFKPDGEPFYGIGMIEFYNRFDEILDYYYAMNPKKKDYVDDIKENRDMVFIHSIPVFTTHLRPIDIHDGDLFFSMENGIYNMINKHAHNINKTSRKMDKNPQIKNSELYKLQMKYMELCEEILNTLSTKYGILRGLIGGRYNFSSRAVIRQDPTLRVDQIKLPYTMLVKTQQQRIINILMRSYNMNPSQAYQIYQSALSSYNEQVAQILNNIIRESGEGLPCILNRNPTMVLLNIYNSLLKKYFIN